MDQVQRIGHALGRMVDIALKVDKRRDLLEHAVAVTLAHRLGNLMHIGVALADVHIIADTDNIGHEGDHVRRLADRLAVRDLRFALVEVLNLQPEHVAGGGEAEARARRIVAEQRDAKAALKNLGGDVLLAHVAQRVGDSKDGFQLVVRFLPGEEEIIFVHALEVELVEFIDISLQFLIHYCYPFTINRLCVAGRF